MAAGLGEDLNYKHTPGGLVLGTCLDRNPLIVPLLLLVQSESPSTAVSEILNP